ncbi:sulfatase-like hydrolase/transferase [bacterium]|nr:sulfatase-like hydrolase/transferase [bacterium]MCI0603471.1 sulfatase-like hydrolase/transferase [bacterium]
MWRSSLFVICALGLAIAAAVFFRKPSSEAPATTNTVVEKPNVLVITIDTLRPDHLGAYGYNKIRTPVLDRLAQNGVLFRHAICQTPLTLVSHSSIFTGLNPNVHGVRDNAYFTLSSNFKTLAEYLKEEGYTTAAFIGSAILDRRHGLAQGFDWYSRYQPTIVVGMESQRRAEEVVSETLDWLQKRAKGKTPYHLWIHLYDPHTPYDAPEPFRSEYSTSPYDGEIAYTDHVLGVLLKQLEEIEFLQNALVAVMGDHGESLGEHRESDHGFFVYDATVKIPFVLSWPGHLQSRVVEEQVQSIDILPTIADLLGFKTDGSVQGKTMRALLEGRETDTPPAYLESLTPKLYYSWSELTSLRTNDWKYIEAPDPELYNLKDDPEELRNLIAESPDQARQMREQLMKLIAIGQKAQDKQAESLDAERLEQLASLGYIGATNPAAMMNASSNIDPKSKIEDYLLHHKLVPEAIGYIDQSQYQKALQLLGKVKSKFPNSFVLYWYIGLCHAKLNRLEDARKAYSHTIELNPYFGRAYTDLALTLELQGHHQEAMKLLDTIPSTALSITDVDFTRGEIQMHHGSFGEAERFYRSSLQSDPQNSETEYALARLYLATGRIDEAVTKMHALARIHYPSEDVYYSLSAIYLKMGNLQEAEKVLHQWQEIFPRSAAASYRYGIFLAGKGDREQAISYLERAVRIDPSLKEAQQALADIKKGANSS